MATNPFQRFARGAASAASTAAPAASITSTTLDVDKQKAEDILRAAKKRKRAIEVKPEHEPITNSPPLVREAEREIAASDDDQNARRVSLLQQIVEARRDGPDAAIDRYGTQACVFHPTTTNPATQRFQILVAALFSSQTQDPITYAAMQRLHTLLDSSIEGLETEENESEGLTIAKVRVASIARLEELLKPVGFYHRKAQQLKQIAETLYRNYRNDIPRTLDGLLALPGVGPKIARVILLLAWDDIDAGLIVDTHVHRLSQRLGWVRENGTKTPEQTRAELEAWVPREYWREFSRLVVGFGQNVCVAVHPKCVECPLAPSCPSAFTYRHPSTQKLKKKKAATSIPLAYEHASDDAF